MSSKLALAVLSFIIPSAVVAQASLPSSGTISVHGGWKLNDASTRLSDERMFLHGAFWGVVFNDQGPGPLHEATAVCLGLTEMTKDIGKGNGKCVWTDSEGHTLTVDWIGDATGGGFTGTNRITAGTGKFDGMRGGGPFKCRILNANLQGVCTQRFDYSITP